jgi:hypothetical protein
VLHSFFCFGFCLNIDFKVISPSLPVFRTTVASLPPIVAGILPTVASLQPAGAGFHPPVASLQPPVASLQTPVASLQTAVASLRTAVANPQPTVKMRRFPFYDWKANRQILKAVAHKYLIYSSIFYLFFTSPEIDFVSQKRLTVNVQNQQI